MAITASPPDTQHQKTGAGRWQKTEIFGHLLAKATSKVNIGNGVDD